jgi:hypothetical protein
MQIWRQHVASSTQAVTAQPKVSNHHLHLLARSMPNNRLSYLCQAECMLSPRCARPKSLSFYFLIFRISKFSFRIPALDHHHHPTHMAHTGSAQQQHTWPLCINCSAKACALL